MAGRTLVESWYDAHAEMEEHRLDEGRLEFEVTMRVIGSCISSLKLDKVKILDIGGGPGKYGKQSCLSNLIKCMPKEGFLLLWLTGSAAIALAKQGHGVTLNDLSHRNLEVAKGNAEKASVRLDAIIHANALAIPQCEPLQACQGSFDVVLCLGPLYHLLDPEERSTVIRNSILMAKPGGYVLLAYVTVYAHLRDMGRRDPSRLVKEWDFYERYLNSGEYTRKVETESFHVYPADLEKELQAFGGQARVERTVSCEGFLGFDGARGLAKLKDEELERWLDIIMRSAEDKETMNSADHLLVVLRKM